MGYFASLSTAFAILLVLGGCWELDLPDTKSPGFDEDELLDTSFADPSDISLETDSTTEGTEDTESGSDTSVASTVTTCPEIPCEWPPPSICKNSSTLRVYLEQGTCYEGECIYAWNLVPCDEFGCADGQCLEDPCEEIICNLAPNNKCADEETLIVWDTEGECDTAAVCHYPGTYVDCPLGCDDGACT